ncbi:hypothetical protein AC249_AIPGENE3857 [Exaiptasia diaphana]|nr:hypothetical protein AC249_AIPGENE3857 [Exaiptasia diaphana]
MACAVTVSPLTDFESITFEVLYVARIRLGSDQTPGKMDVSNRKAHASWGGHEHSDNHYQILTNPGWKSHLEWQASRGNQVPANAVLGGYDEEYGFRVVLPLVVHRLKEGIRTETYVRAGTLCRSIENRLDGYTIFS